MAKTPISDEELQLKKRARRRLVGAVVLVLLVVVLVPMFLDRTPRPQKQDIDIKIPAVPGQSDAPASAPSAGAAPADNVPAPPATANPPAATPPAPVAETPAPKAPTPPVPAVAATAHDPEAAATEPKHVEAKSSSEDGYVIQVGAFANATNAKNLLQKLKAEKIPAYSELIGTPSAGKTRVRVGPYSSIQAAEKGRERLKAVKLLPPGEAKIVRKGE
ncbi:MAG: SPOR domain-containing protein [Betaproteobacteria bacterium]